VNTSESSIVCLTETHVTEEITSSELNIKNFRLEQCCTENIRTGGVMIYVKKGIKYEVEKIERIEDYVWMVSLKINLADENYLLTAFTTRQINRKLDLSVILKSTWKKYKVSMGKKIIVGDFNYDVSTNTFYVKKYKDLIYRNGLFQIVNIPTRQTINSATIIDHIITDQKNLQWNILQTPRISDHHIIRVNVENLQQNGNVLIERRDYKNYNKEIFQNMLLEYEWNNSISDINIFFHSLHGKYVVMTLIWWM
jgi:hypothetical protein